MPEIDGADEAVLGIPSGSTIGASDYLSGNYPPVHFSKLMPSLDRSDWEGSWE